MKMVIFGCGRIANRIARSALLVKEIDLVGFASRDAGKAKQYAESYGCRDYGDYDHFLNSDVDAVYIAAYNPGHHELIRRCIDAGKQVICEKPMLFSLEENKELFDYAKRHGVLLMEALKSVFLPSIIEIKRMIREGEIGEIRQIYASFMRCGSHDSSHWIHNPQSGGAFKDLGSYCVGTMNFLLDQTPKLIGLQSDRGETAETTAYCELDYDGISGRAWVSNAIDGDTLLRISGTKGTIEVPDFWKQGKIFCEIDGVKQEKQVDLISDFYYELKHFAGLCEEGKTMSPVMSEEASQNILQITGQIDHYEDTLMESPRLILRHWKWDDAKDLYSYAKDPAVGPIAGWPAHQSLEESEQILKTAFNKKECYAICLKPENKAIGCIELKLQGHSDLVNSEEECELGYWLGRPYWGRGLMSEAVCRILRRAFEDLQMKNVWAGYYDGNSRSKHVQEKCGFTYQWTSKDVDVPLMKEKRIGHVNRITYEEWRKQQ